MSDALVQFLACAFFGLLIWLKGNPRVGSIKSSSVQAASPYRRSKQPSVTASAPASCQTRPSVRLLAESGRLDRLLLAGLIADSDRRGCSRGAQPGDKTAINPTPKGVRYDAAP